jgi:NAD(P)-dependent dehydrogenase (short-subunit alcohol dehydrogenase family)
MNEFTGRVAVVTGAAGGIGLALAHRFGAEGMSVVMADVEEATLHDAQRAVAASGAKTLAVRTDVSRWADVAALAERTRDTFGDVHVLCNNAGVHRPGASWEHSLDDWAWILGVNLQGVIHGVRAFVPGMLAHGNEGHVVNTSSAAGLLAAGGNAAYSVSKFGVVALSEGLAAEVAMVPGARLGVSVLCPGGVSTSIYRAERNRPADLPERGAILPAAAARYEALAAPNRTDQVSPAFIADMVLQAIRTRDFYILPMQPHFKASIRERLLRIEAALAASPDTGV